MTNIPAPSTEPTARRATFGSVAVKEAIAEKISFTKDTEISSFHRFIGNVFPSALYFLSNPGAPFPNATKVTPATVSDNPNCSCSRITICLYNINNFHKQSCSIKTVVASCVELTI